jgi:predicted oxidoreductase
MTYIPFGESRTQVSQVAIGMMRTYDMTIDQHVEFLETGLDCGINFLDTADIYGKGRSEEVLGDTFAAHPHLRDKFFLQSKCGIRQQEFVWYDFSKEHILESVEGSLRRLRTDHLDSLLLHRPDALMEPQEIAEAFSILHQQGKVLNFGVSNMNPMQIDIIAKYVPFKISANQIQLSCAFTPTLNAGLHVNNMVDDSLMRDGGILEYCRVHDIAVQAWSVLQYGHFGGVFVGSEQYPKLTAVLNAIAEQQGVAATAVAIAWILRYPHDMQAVVGTTKKEHLKQLAEASKVVLQRKQWYEILTAAGNSLP